MKLNGWGNEDESGTNGTNDGSGIATLIKLKKVTITNNVVYACYRAGLYIKDSYDIVATGNIINKTNTSVGEGIYVDTGFIVFISNNSISVPETLPSFKLYSLSSNTMVNVSNNYFNGLIEFAGGAYTKCEFNYNNVRTKNQVNIPISITGNKFEIYGGGQNGVYLTASHITFKDNYVSAANYALISPSGINGVNIIDNTIIGGNGGIRIDSNYYSKISGNYGSGVGSAGIHLLACGSCELSSNKASSVSGNSFRVESTCTLTNKWGNYVIAGPSDYAGTYGINY